MALFTRLKRFYHTTLGQPFRLAVRIDEGKGIPIVFLHGIAADYRVWESTAEQLKTSGRIIVIDLLGFGQSPSPNYSDYRISDHANSVVHTLNSMHVKGPIIIVGHSLGCLVALEIARKNPKLVSRLVLASPPIFTKDIASLSSQFKTSLYSTAYQAIIKQPRLTTEATALVSRLQPKESHFIVTIDSWTAFRQTLINSVLEPANYNALLATQVPTDIIYGRFDILILKKPLTEAVAKNKNLSLHRVNEPHEITKTYSHFVVKLIKFMLEDLEVHKIPPEKRTLSS